MQATHCATFPVAESSTPEVEESASQTGVVESTLHPSAFPDMRPQTLQAPEERHLLETHIPWVVPSPGVVLSVVHVKETAYTYVVYTLLY